MSADPKLTIELVPSTAWCANVRSTITPEQWDIVRRAVYRAANHRCEICGGAGDQWPVECHEVWHYDDSAHVQRLVRMIALCPACHAVKHMGRSHAAGKGREALAHLAKVNGWDYAAAGRYFVETMQIWTERSNHQWQLDLSALATYLPEWSGP
jgi:hypothetical protein